MYIFWVEWFDWFVRNINLIPNVKKKLEGNLEDKTEWDLCHSAEDLLEKHCYYVNKQII